MKVFLKDLTGEAGTPYYRVDFLVEGRLVVEVDSYTHQKERQGWDAKRDNILKKLGYTIVHLANDSVNQKLVRCVAQINQAFRASQTLGRSGGRVPT